MNEVILTFISSRLSLVARNPAGEDMEKGELFCTVGGNADWCSHCGKQYGDTSNNKNGSTCWPSDPTSGNISEGTHKTNLKEHKHLYVHCSVVYNGQDMETPKGPSVDEWIKQLWDIYTMEYYSAVKKKFYHLWQYGWTGEHYAKWNKLVRER